MSWFIVRTHRYTKGLHWRDGVILEYEGHEARVELNPMLREVRLSVQGVQPQNLFTLLKSTMDLILDRFEGLDIERRVPCKCHEQAKTKTLPCSRFFLYEDLTRRMEARKNSIECPETFESVSVPKLLYGIHTSTDQQVMNDIRDTTEEIKRTQDLDSNKINSGLNLLEAQTAQMGEMLMQVSQLKELVVQNFTRSWNLEMAKIETECPNMFLLMPGDRSKIDPRNWVSTNYDLYLVCQHLPGPHMVGDGYSLRQSAEWWATVSPWLVQLIKLLSHVLPVAKAVTGLSPQQPFADIKNHLEVMEQLVKFASEVPELNRLKDVKSSASSDASTGPDLATDLQVEGAALRAFYGFLKAVDPANEWRGLYRTLTPDGNILWLCEEHRRPYQVKPLRLETDDRISLSPV